MSTSPENATLPESIVSVCYAPCDGRSLRRQVGKDLLMDKQGKSKQITYIQLLFT